MIKFNVKNKDHLLLIGFIIVVALAPIIMAPIGGGYPDLLQKFAIFGIFAIGFNILFGLTGYLSFGHAAFLGVGSYTAVWTFKLLTMNVIPALILSTLLAGVFALLIGFIVLRRSGIYFSILTLAFAQMSYNLAYSVLTPITNGETGLQLRLHDARVLDGLFGVTRGEGLPSTSLFGMSMSGWSGYYFCTLALLCYSHSALAWNVSVSIVILVLALLTANAFPGDWFIIGKTTFADDSTMIWVSACSSVSTTEALCLTYRACSWISAS